MYGGRNSHGYDCMSEAQSHPGDKERYSRRLSDKIQAAFDHACDDGELIVATELLETLELVLLRTPPRADRRETVVGPLLASHERLWHLKSGRGAPIKTYESTSEES
jgi:hypothetical protein